MARLYAALEAAFPWVLSFNVGLMFALQVLNKLGRGEHFMALFGVVTALAAVHATFKGARS